MVVGLLITYQCIIQDYPVEACIRSLLGIADVVYINDGGSSDGTLDVLNLLVAEYGRDRVVILSRKWVHDRYFWARERNYILDNYIKNENTWVLSLDADEVLHEGDFATIKKSMLLGDSLSFNVVHFYGTPSHIIQGDVWFTRHTQLWKLGTGIRWLHRDGGCADDIVWPDGAPAHLTRYIDSGATLYHYGHCRNARAMGMKVKRADDLYQYSDNYKQGNLAKVSSWKYDMDRVGIKPFGGTHPTYVNVWVDNHNEQDMEFLV